MADAVGMVSTVAVALGVGSALYVALDVAAGHHQKMWIMNVVCPATALWAGPIGIWVFAGFATAYPVNRWLRRRGVKEPM